MKLTLTHRSESIGNDKMQLTFSEPAPRGAGNGPTPPMAGPSPGGASGISLTGWFDRAEALTYEVGQTYDVSMTPSTPT